MSAMKKKDRDSFLRELYKRQIQNGEYHNSSFIIASELRISSKEAAEIASYWIKLGALESLGFGGGSINVRLTPYGINLVEDSSKINWKSVGGIIATLASVITILAFIF